MSIDCFNYTTAHLYGDALASQFELRKRVFVDRENYAVPIWKDMEFDQFDTPATQYFVWRDQRGVARGVARLAPTTLRYMLEELWPDKITGAELPHAENVWEATRFGVDTDLSFKQRMQIVRELMCALLEYAMMHGIDEIIGMSSVSLIHGMFARNGWKADMISPVWNIDGVDVQAGILPVSMEVLQNVRRCTKVSNVLHLLGEDHAQVREAA